ncbi:hypothetical protein [Streptomyces sp. NPDC048637]|uniref:hypothetical protein n=1 Tax=Streptomyces sp. NPDC048637 TaxID=3155636 RepID=UPI003434DCD6
MSTTSLTEAPLHGAAPSPFAGADICGLAGFVLPIGAARSVFEDESEPTAMERCPGRGRCPSAAYGHSPAW